ncbi:MAG TPA: DUF1592 domain-containing protein [Polyangia bacterium]|nr:DUF1592 domain-containing protein [Polyangia bacterium]
MRATFRFGVLTAAALIGAAGCQGSINGQTGSADTGNGASGQNSGSGASGPNSGNGGSGQNSGNGGSGQNSGNGGSGQSTGSGGNGTACTPLPPIPRRLWRLSVEQWGAAVQTLLGLKSAPVLSSRGGEQAFAFFSDSTLGVDNAMQFDMYNQAEAVLTSIDSSVTTTIAPCTGTTATAQTTCANTFVSSFAQKAYRRPLDASEVTNLMKVYAQGAMQDYKTGIKLMIEAIIISPSFIYRTELGPTTTADASGKYPDTTMTPYEVASQLGFTLLGTLPDADLLAAAANGSLGTTAGISTQIDRLLALPAVQANLTNIVLGWFNISQLFSKTKDTALISKLPTAEQDLTGIENDLFTSTQQFVNSVLWGSGSGKIDDLMTSQTVYVNQRLATLYPNVSFSGGKAPTSDSTFVAGTWASSEGRSGILTQPGYLWSASDPAATSIVKRGKGIHDNVMCQDSLGSPVDLSTPMAVAVINCTNPSAPAGTAPDSTCDSEILKSDARMTYQPCKTCHSQMDPYSRVLQNFGPIGNYRTVDEAGRAIDTSVTFVPSSPLAGTTLSGAQAFTKALVSSGVIDGCSVQQMSNYAMGASIQKYNTCEINAIRSQTDGTIKSLFKNVLLASFMRARTGGTK